MLVRFECCCIGFLGVQGDNEGRPLIVKSCDGDNGREGENEFHLYRRDHMKEKSYEPLPDEEASELLAELSLLVVEGYRYRQVRWLLNIPDRSA